MIKQMNSQAMMNMIDDTLDTIRYVRENMADVKQQIETKMTILNTYYETANKILASINSGIKEAKRKEDTIIFGLDHNNVNKIINGSYSLYGQTIHPSFARIPDQVFNFITGANQSLFKDNVSVSFIINGEKDYKEEYDNILKDESDQSKLDVFKSFDILPENQHTLTLAIEVQPSNLVGNTKCNMLEISPYLPGTFDITGIRIWTIEQYLTQDMDIPQYNSSLVYRNVGAQRILLDDTYQIYRMEMDIQLHMPSDMSDYFGLRHLYFYNADLDKENSYVIVKITKDSYISSVDGSVTIYTDSDLKNTDSNRYCFRDNPGIQYYMLYENNMLQGEITGAIARNIRELYVRIPLFEPIKAIHFNDIQVR